MNAGEELYLKALLQASEARIRFSPSDCIEILIELYGRRLEFMTGPQLFRMVEGMIQLQGDPQLQQTEIIEAITNYIQTN